MVEMLKTTAKHRLAKLALCAMLFAIGGYGPLAAGDQKPATKEAKQTLTGKEVLAGKATDEQRVDNCKVPADKRGTTPRPEGCSQSRLPEAPARDVDTGAN